MSRAFPVSGLSQVIGNLSAIGKRIESQAARSGLTAAAAVVRDEARIRAPKKTGAMAKSIKTGSPKRNADGSYSVSIRPQGKHAYLALFHEYGVAQHTISREDKKLSAKVAKARASGGRADVLDDIEKRASRSVMKIGDEFVSGAITHPGHAAQPFFRPALDAKAEEAVKAFRDKVVAVVEGKTGFNLEAGLDEAA